MVPARSLTRFPVFSRLPKPLLTRLAKTVVEESRAAGAVIFAEGKWGDALYLVAKGEVHIRKTIDKAAGTFKLVAALVAGEFFGEMALLEDAPRSAAAIAQTDVVLYRLPRREFSKLLKSTPKTAIELFRGLINTLSTRLRETTREMVAVFEVGRALAQGLEINVIAGRILSLLKQSFEKDIFGAFYHWNEFNREYDLLAGEGDLPEAFRGAREKNDPLAAWLAGNKSTFLANQWEADGRLSVEEKARWPGCRALLAVPLFDQKGLMLGFIVYGHAKTEGIFTNAFRQVLEGISNLVAPAFESAAWRKEEESRRRLERSRPAV